MKLLFRIFFVGLFFSIIFLLDGHGESSFWTAIGSAFIILVVIPSIAVAKWFARRDRENEAIEKERQGMSNEAIARKINDQQARNNIAALQELEWHECAESIYLHCKN